MPSAFHPPHTTDGKRFNQLRTLDAETLEEYRLLGIRSHKDEDDPPVPIQKPRSSWEEYNMPGKIFNGGPCPTNTLATSYTKQNSTTNYEAKSPRQLQMKAVRGKNVKNQSSDLDFSYGFPKPPLAKRRKIEQIKIDSSSNSDASFDDPMKESSPRNLTFRSKQNNGSGPGQMSLQGRSSGYGTKSNIGGVLEYNKVEDMMNSNSKKKKRLKHRRSKESHSEDGSTSKLPFLEVESKLQLGRAGRWSGDSRSLADERSSDTRPSDMETLSEAYKEALPNGNTCTKVPRPTPERSPFWSTPQKSFSREHTAHDEKEALQPKTPHQDLMSKQFVAENGKRRGDTVQGSSPDELLSETTVGCPHVNQVNHSLNKRQQQNQSPVESSSTSKRSILMKDSVGLDPSNIKSTQFGTSNSGKRALRGQEAYPPWSLDVVAIILPGDQCYRNDNLGLVHDESSDVYIMHQEGKHISIKGLVPVVYPKKLHKVIHEQDGRKIRFESAKMEGEDNVLDIEIAREKDKQHFFARLTARHEFRVTGCPSEKMEKMFEIRRNQHKISRAKSQHATIGSTSRPLPGSADLQSSTSTGSTHRIRTKLIDELMQRAGETKQIPQSEPLSKIPDGSGTLSQHSSKATSRISPLLKGLKPKLPEQNNHLRRSARISDPSSNLRGNTWDGFEEPNAVKYSKVHGLGRKWKKPLTYPKTGRKKATVDFVDLERLDEGEMLNDTLVTFHMRFLEHQAEQNSPDLARRVYFFSTFFYQRLTDFARGTKEVNYSAVQSWTRTVDIFTYDYVVVPINEAAHWYLAIICNLPALDRRISLSDDDGNESAIHDSQPPPSPRSLDFGQSVKNSDERFDLQPEDPFERGTRESFAELKLESNGQQLYEDTHDDVGTEGKRNRNADEEEMLDMPEKSELHPHNSKAEAVPVPSFGNIDDSVQDGEFIKKAPGSSKKTKRKPLPPVTHVDPKRPLIITFDSLGAPHGNTIRFLKEYLTREMEAKRGSTNMDIGSIKGINAKCIPQQSNFSDCGLYMLGYLDKFMSDGPLNFITKTIKREYKEEDWLELVPSKMRSTLRDRLLKLGAQYDEEVRAAKAQSKRNNGEPKARSPSNSSAPSANGQERTNASSIATSSRTSPDSIMPPASGKAQETAQLSEETVNHDPIDNLPSGANDYQQEASDHEKESQSRKPLGDITPPLMIPRVVINSQSPNRTHTDPLSPQMPKHLPEQRTTSPELPVEVKDSQEPVHEPKIGPSLEKSLEQSLKRHQETEKPPHEIRVKKVQSKAEPIIPPRSVEISAEPSSPKRKRHDAGPQNSEPPILESDGVERAKKRNKTKRYREHGETTSERRDIINID